MWKLSLSVILNPSGCIWCRIWWRGPLWFLSTNFHSKEAIIFPFDQNSRKIRKTHFQVLWSYKGSIVYCVLRNRKFVQQRNRKDWDKIFWIGIFCWKLFHRHISKFLFSLQSIVASTFRLTVTWEVFKVGGGLSIKRPDVPEEKLS